MRIICGCAENEHLMSSGQNMSDNDEDTSDDESDMINKFFVVKDVIEDKKGKMKCGAIPLLSFLN
jgi:hypothetical protein